MTALFINSNGYIYAQHNSITSDELTELGIDHVMVNEMPPEIVNQQEKQLVKVVSRDPLILELEDIPAPPEPPKTPEQERIEQLEAELSTLKAAMDELILSGGGL
ncbi:hypothetical protein [Paenibacillus spongiae]|uniref:Uncharacterized protein n=1 Tax=Paenibacillus spongiae TaxID=2909671 RepID=A0ABY5SIL4_9BACL|nr:hypothetical protein [Paenibacillus spongiae]UVI32098.1 hypothetical protein L1F29_09875 [Paenibacillus spongiae]